MRGVLGFLVLVSGTAVPPATTQTPEREVLAVVQRLFDGMRARDTAAMRATLHPDARLSGGTPKDGALEWKAESPDRWLASVARPRPERLDERTHDPVVQVDGALAAVWVEYSFYLGERLQHCGIDAMHLVKEAGGWRIISLADTRRTEGCADKSGPPPR